MNKGETNVPVVVGRRGTAAGRIVAVVAAGRRAAVAIVARSILWRGRLISIGAVID